MWIENDTRAYIDIGESSKWEKKQKNKTIFSKQPLYYYKLEFWWLSFLLDSSQPVQRCVSPFIPMLAVVWASLPGDGAKDKLLYIMDRHEWH